MNSTEALDTVESIFTQIKAGTLRAEVGNYWFIQPTKKRFFVNTIQGFVTYLELYENDTLIDRVYESLTVVDDNGVEIRFGDQWSPLVELTEQEKARFTTMLNTFLGI